MKSLKDLSEHKCEDYMRGDGGGWVFKNGYKQWEHVYHCSICGKYLGTYDDADTRID